MVYRYSVPNRTAHFPPRTSIHCFDRVHLASLTGYLLFLQFTPYSATPLLLILQPSTVFAHAASSTSSDSLQSSLPFRAFEPTVDMRDRKSRSVFVEASFTVETGEAERIAVDWTARGGSGGTSCEHFVADSLESCTDILAVESHLTTQRAAVKMLHDRILLLTKYVTDVLAGASRSRRC